MMVDEYTCPRCKAKHDAITALYEENVVPKPGDATICLYCGGVNIFTAGLTLRIPAQDEFIALLGSPEILAALVVWHGLEHPQ